MCGYGVGGYCEGRVYVSNTVGGVVRLMTVCVVSAMSRTIVSGAVVSRDVVLV